MTEEGAVGTRATRALLWTLLGLTAVIVVVSAGLIVVHREVAYEGWGVRGFPVVVGALVGAVGALIASRRPQHPIGWLSLAAGLLGGIQGITLEYALAGTVRELPATDFVAWLHNFFWVAPVGVIFLGVLLRFPDGRLPSRRWRPVVWLGVTGVGVAVAGMATVVGPLENLSQYDNPFGMEALGPVPDLAAAVGSLLFTAAIVATAVSLVLRYRRSVGEERLQMRWFAASAGLTAVVFVSMMLVYVPVLLGAADWDVRWAELLVSAAFLTLPVTIGVAVLRYRLYDIDLVLSRALLFAGLAGFITAVYVAFVLGVGTLLGRGDEPNLLLALVATTVVAIAFQPARLRLQHAANRLVYGERATPYEVLSALSEQLGETIEPQRLLERAARVLAEGTGAERAVVWLRVGDRLRVGTSWPAGDEAEDARLVDGGLPPLDGWDRVEPVVHDEELLGALSVRVARGVVLSPVEDKLVADLARQAGLVLRNVGLTAELMARVDELRASRQRLVAAQDEERRRLERDLHDGAQQHLVALKIKAAAVATLAGRGDLERLRDLAEGLSQDADQAIESLRETAHGIYPPLLAAEGLAVALGSRARRVPQPVVVETDGLDRYHPEVEAAVYFCVLEALQNAAKYAEGSRVVVRLEQLGGELHFEVADDGSGFDPGDTAPGVGLTNMRDRLDALGGTLTIRSEPGEGTTVSGSLPILAGEPELQPAG